MFNRRKKQAEKINERIKFRDAQINRLSNENQRLNEKIIDLENNIDFLVYNLSPQKRRLARPDNQN